MKYIAAYAAIVSLALFSGWVVTVIIGVMT